MKESVWTAGKIYEEVYRMRKDIDELKDALTAIADKLGERHSAYKLLDKQKTEKFKELSDFEKQLFTLGNHQNYKIDLDFMPDTPASRPF